jgi:uncharacterized protein YfiM (DUF2279 family)
MHACILAALLLACTPPTGDTVPTATSDGSFPMAPAPPPWRPLPTLPDQPAAPRDPWLAQDKARHFAMSFAATAFAYAGARTTLDPDPAAALAGATALAAGIAKELHDARAGRWFSLPDMAWNAAGVALGLAFVHQIR